MIPAKPLMIATAILFLVLALAQGDVVTTPLGDPALDPPTLHCLSMYWVIQGDPDGRARVECRYRPAGAAAWRRGMDLFRVEQGANRLESGRSLVNVPDGARLFAGSIFGLKPDSEYEVRLTFAAPDGKNVSKTLKAHTRAEPRAPKEMRALHVVPGSHVLQNALRKGIGTLEDPFQGLVAAEAAARPGSVFLLHEGVYEGVWELKHSGAPGHPIIWRAAGDGEVIIDAQGQADDRPERAIAASDRHDIWFERLTIRRAKWGLVAHMSSRIVVHRCYMNRFTNCFQGISVQPVYGGPIYVFRNALYNLEVEVFKMHNSPSGALFFHNTAVKKGPPLILSTSEKVRNCVSRNNLFVGTEGRACDCDPPMIKCDFDYDGFGETSGKVFLKWNQVRYASLAEVKAKAPVYRHAIVVDPANTFASGILPPKNSRAQYLPADVDLRLKAGSAALDAGVLLSGLNDTCTGNAPDLGAYEFGSPLPHYGPRTSSSVGLATTPRILEIDRVVGLDCGAPRQ